MRWPSDTNSARQENPRQAGPPVAGVDYQAWREGHPQADVNPTRYAKAGAIVGGVSDAPTEIHTEFTKNVRSRSAHW
jgi:hypothetical protein